MNRVRWAAWGVVDIEKLERMQRRNYIKAVRKEIAEKGWALNCGGSTRQPYYQFQAVQTTGVKHAAAGVDAFKKACMWLLETIGEEHVGSADGGVRCAGDEAPGVEGSVHE